MIKTLAELESEISGLKAEVNELRATKTPNLTVIAAYGAVGGAALAWGVLEPNRDAVTVVVMLATAVVAWMTS